MIQIFKKDIYYLVFGLISLAIGLSLAYFRPELPIIDFLSGLFVGLSIPLNLIGIYKVSLATKQNNE